MNHKSHQAEHNHGDRWSAVDNYLICISECDLNDGTCITRCLDTHLKEEDDTTSHQ
jgi:hypothetical protein